VAPSQTHTGKTSRLNETISDSPTITFKNSQGISGNCRIASMALFLLKVWKRPENQSSGNEWSGDANGGGMSMAIFDRMIGQTKESRARPGNVSEGMKGGKLKI